MGRRQVITALEQPAFGRPSVSLEARDSLIAGIARPTLRLGTRRRCRWASRVGVAQQGRDQRDHVRELSPRRRRRRAGLNLLSSTSDRVGSGPSLYVKWTSFHHVVVARENIFILLSCADTTC